MDRDRPLLTDNIDSFEKALNKLFKSTKRNIIAQMIDAYDKSTKADDDSTDDSYNNSDHIDDIIEAIDFDPWAKIVDPATAGLDEVMQDGSAQAFVQIGVFNQDMADTVAKKLSDDASYRAAEMVGKKLVNGKLVDNPDAQWVITDSTRNMLKADLEKAYDEGWSSGQLKQELINNYAFSPARAETISRTEIALADIHGNMTAYRESGVVFRKKWITGAECCDICEINADEGAIDLDDEFPSGDDAPPAHPNCRCDIIPITTKED